MQKRWHFMNFEIFAFFSGKYSENLQILSIRSIENYDFSRSVDFFLHGVENAKKFFFVGARPFFCCCSDFVCWQGKMNGKTVIDCVIVRACTWWVLWSLSGKLANLPFFCIILSFLYLRPSVHCHTMRAVEVLSAFIMRALGMAINVGAFLSISHLHATFISLHIL